ncbi:MULTISPECIES: condensin complex protein MksE [unclassified Polaribacter]|uniref:condensin complex protein MksE n=1 Tax=unclassified Polaribacter TaxID=196858 RepID=UPI0011BDC1AD|nr:MULTISPECIES: hypothetical protein [unclassified Polaribacter]TXD53543.1 hypothetical protein ES043_03930 [Polaribacter sp. IC063]TXD58615.1 hypothetical protein ES044_11895 [Polaribacter sp. IC066]
MITKYTSEIFEILRKGNFICSNSPNEQIQKLYTVLENPDNFEDLHDYFYQIKYVLEQGNEYFYFSRAEKNVDLDRKLEKAFQWIDVLDFVKTFDSAFDVGYRFSPSDIINQLKNNADLNTKLKTLKKITSDKKTNPDRVKKVIEKLVKDNFITLENEITETYKVLTSFNYLKDIITTINIPEEVENEIPE